MSSPDECKHEWMRGQNGEGDHCLFCGVAWVDWTRGFDSNVRPMRKKTEPDVRPNSA